MSIINNIEQIPKNTEKLNSAFVESELCKLGYVNILRWSIVEIGAQSYTINFCTY